MAFRYHKELKVGLLTVVSFAVLYVGFNYLKGSELFSSEKKYYVTYPFTGELEVSNPVVINGFPVGKVSAMRMLQDQDHKILVEISVDDAIVVGKHSVAELQSSSLLGGKHIALLLSSAQESLSQGDTLEARMEETFTDNLTKGNMAHNIDSTLLHVKNMMSELSGSGALVKRILHRSDTLAQYLQRLTHNNEQQFTQIIRSLASGSRALDSSLQGLDSLMMSMNRTVHRVDSMPLEEATQHLNASLAQIEQMLEAINAQKGLVGKLVHDEVFYDTLLETMNNLSTLLTHFNEAPRDFLSPLGRKEKKLKWKGNHKSQKEKK